MTAPGGVLLVFTNLPDRAAALSLAHTLVGEKLAACVNVLGECESVYRWKDESVTAREVPLLIKTTAPRYPELEAAIRRLHPYELPEIIAVSLAHGLPDYLQWVTEETRTP